MKLHYLVALLLTMITVQTKAWSCSIAIEEDQMKNFMIANTANKFNIALTKATKLKAENFAYRLYGNVPGSSCENFLEFTSKVTITYRKSILEVCELSTDVVLTQNLHATGFPYEEYEFLYPASSCRRVPIRVTPRPIPFPIRN